MGYVSDAGLRAAFNCSPADFNGPIATKSLAQLRSPQLARRDQSRQSSHAEKPHRRSAQQVFVPEVFNMYNLLKRIWTKILPESHPTLLYPVLLAQSDETWVNTDQPESH